MFPVSWMPSPVDQSPDECSVVNKPCSHAPSRLTAPAGRPAAVASLTYYRTDSDCVSQMNASDRVAMVVDALPLVAF